VRSRSVSSGLNFWQRPTCRDFAGDRAAQLLPQLQAKGEPKSISEVNAGDRRRIIVADIEDVRISRQQFSSKVVAMNRLEVANIGSKRPLEFLHYPTLPPSSCAVMDLPILVETDDVCIRIELA
jgi:hypothetical protein